MVLTVASVSSGSTGAAMSGTRYSDGAVRSTFCALSVKAVDETY